MVPRIVIEMAVAVACVVGGMYYGAVIESDRRDAAELAEAKGRREALEAVAQELVKLKVVNKATTNILEKETITEIRYRDTVNTDTVMRILNDALKGTVTAERLEQP